MIATNGQIIGAATEGYRRQEYAKNNLRSIAKYATENNIRIASEGAALRPPNANLPLEFYEDGGSWRWRITATNGLILHASSEGFASKANAKANLESLLLAVADM